MIAGLTALEGDSPELSGGPICEVCGGTSSGFTRLMRCKITRRPVSMRPPLTRRVDAVKLSVELAPARYSFSETPC